MSTSRGSRRHPRRGSAVALRGREALGVLLESLDAEELGADGLFGVRKGIDRGAEVADEGEDTWGF